jgi:UDP-N-acetylmuramoylalanine--D-glutamate ligase
MEAARAQMTPTDAQRTSIVLGLGVTGVSCVRWLLARGDRVIAMDSRTQPPGLDQVLALADRGQALRAESAPIPATLEVVTGGFCESVLSGADVLVVSPGIPMHDPIVAAARARGLDVVGDVELFARETTASVVAITGTNGKSTVTTLVDLMLRASGIASVAGGNIGRPVLALLPPAPEASQADQVAVLELSSFQLERTRSLAPTVAVLLNVSEDHLDHHQRFADYLAAKRAVFRGARRAVVWADQQRLYDVPAQIPCTNFSTDDPSADYHLMERAGVRWLARRGEALLPLHALALVGSHNHANALAAIATVEAVTGQLVTAAALQALAGFRGLAHRMQHVRSRAGVVWVNDSKATNPGATLAAVNGIDTPLVLIAGGRGKGADFSPLAAALRDRARAVIVFGEDASRLRDALAPCCDVRDVRDLEQAVALAAELARAGDTVLLAPACASQDMFVDYRERGDQFTQYVEALR